MELLRSYLAADGARLVAEGARLEMIGRRDRLPRDPGRPGGRRRRGRQRRQ